MTQRTEDIVERFRYRVDNYIAHYSTSDRDLDKLILAEITRLRQRLSELEARLEIDHAFRLENGKLVRFEIPAEERGNYPDGIECRDATIKLLEEQLGRTPNPAPRA